MTNPHLQVIEAAVSSDKALAKLYASNIGTKARPKGDIMSAYRRAKTDLFGNVGRPAAHRILSAYRDEVSAAARAGAQRAVEIGREQAQRTAEALNIRMGLASTGRLIDETVTRVLNVVDGQIRAIESGTLTEAQVLGDEGRVGLFAPGVVQREAANAYANLAALLFGQMVFVGPDVQGNLAFWRKQAIAAIDNKTTPCCLNVHGQTVPVDGFYTTTAPPAYAREQERPPFHDSCRTAQTLVPVEMAADDLTADMIRAARLEESLRGTPGYEVPKFINAFTRIRR